MPQYGRNIVDTQDHAGASITKAGKGTVSPIRRERQYRWRNEHVFAIREVPRDCGPEENRCRITRTVGNDEDGDPAR